MQYELIGRTEPDAPAVLLSSGLGGTRGFWKPQLDALSQDFRVVLYDQRGTGANAGPLPAGYRIEDMAGEVLEILDAARIPQVSVIGHAVGGLIGLALALQQPQRLRNLVLINAWDRVDAHTARCFDARLHVLHSGGAPAYVNAQPIFLYPASWLADHAEAVEAEVAHGIAHFQGHENLLTRIAALRAFDASAAQLTRIQTRTLVMAARDDVLVPWQRSRQLATHLPNARLHLSAEGGHAHSVTQAAEVNAALLAFLKAT